MNSALQCLGNTKPLAEYFIGKGGQGKQNTHTHTLHAPRSLNDANNYLFIYYHYHCFLLSFGREAIQEAHQQGQPIGDGRSHCRDLRKLTGGHVEWTEFLHSPTSVQEHHRETRPSVLWLHAARLSRAASVPTGRATRGPQPC